MPWIIKKSPDFRCWNKALFRRYHIHEWSECRWFYENYIRGVGWYDLHHTLIFCHFLSLCSDLTIISLYKIYVWMRMWQCFWTCHSSFTQNSLSRSNKSYSSPFGNRLTDALWKKEIKLSILLAFLQDTHSALKQHGDVPSSAMPLQISVPLSYEVDFALFSCKQHRFTTTSDAS